MAVKTFTSTEQLKKMLEPLISKAIEKASQRLLSKLQEYIMEDYYNLYQPKIYQRTMSFYSSAVSNLLSPTSAEIGMDDTLMNYNNYWDGETQLYMADAGFHGNSGIYREGFFFKDFLAWCDENATAILVDELKKQGVPIV
jgi:hypothetical protein